MVTEKLAKGLVYPRLRALCTNSPRKPTIILIIAQQQQCFFKKLTTNLKQIIINKIIDN